ncbi:uncharacterized protein LOC119070562 [Bradysia coprophila]|uniref:uncharacterized protein LOC119070562 n=1 Tax=Bradysia coprophila TaxID=38358 RepID=UPI00187DCB53|nr:uncharacterized protein LOC119070562 [Bradysia coprophila]
MNRKCIRSYAFLDLETTGLPAMEFNKTKITEICVVSVSKDSLLNTEKHELPRVLSKLSFCVNPCKQISSESTRITGLDNFMLENETKFDENFVKLLNHFLLQLPQPVCLVAHNGDRFDFPIMQRQLKTLSMTLPDDTLCMDSLLFFRLYEDYLEREKLDEPKPLPDELPVENYLTETIPSSDAAIETKILTIDEISPVEVTSSNDTQLLRQIIEPSSSTDMLTDIVDINETLSAEDVKAKQIVNESTPSDRKTLAKKELFSKRLSSYGSNSVTPGSKRVLFTPQNGNSSDSPSKRMKFTLTAVHERFFGCEPNQSHYAENDVLALLKCAVASKLEFIEYAAVNAKLFKEIRPLGM